MSFCEIFTKLTLKLPQSSQKPLFRCKKLVINTTKCDLCLFLHKIIFLNVLDNIAPVKQIRLKQRTEPWLTAEILELIKIR